MLRALFSVALLACGSRTQLDTTTSFAQPPSDEPSSDGGPRFACTATTTTTLATFDRSDSTDLFDQIVLDDDYVYIHAIQAILRVSKGGGPSQILVDAYWPGAIVPNLAGFALSPTTITYIANDSLTQVAKAGGAPVTQLHFPFPNAGQLSAAPDGFWVWQFASTANALLKVDSAGKPLGPSLQIDDAATVVDDGTRVWVPTTSSGLLVLENGSLVTASSISLTDLVDDGDALYGVGGEAPQWDTHSRVYRIDKATNAVTVIADDGKIKWGAAVDRDYVYFTQRDDGAVARVSKAGGTPSVVGTYADDSTVGVAVDDDCVYWTVNGLNGPGRVMAAPKK